MTISLDKSMRFLLLAILSCSVVACGFHLRGQASIPESLKTLVLTDNSGSQSFSTSLRIELSRAGITTIKESKAGNDVLELKINPLKSSDTVLARNSSNDITNVERTISIAYFIRQHDGKSLYGPRTVSTNLILSNQNSEESVKAAYNATQTEKMSDDLAKQLIYDLGYANVTPRKD